jgi:mono/diheme cytochrome c family protein
MNVSMGRALGAVLLASSLFTGCGGAAEEAGGEPTTGGEAAAAYAGPVASTDVEAGRQAFEQHCNGCHPGGAQGYGPAVTGLNWDPGHMRQQIREGSGRMPAIGPDALPSEQLEALLAYLQTTGSVAAEATAVQ